MPVAHITGLHVPYEQASEIEDVFFKLLCFLPEIHEYAHTHKNLEIVYVYRGFQC